MLYCCITPERERKTARIMTALVAGACPDDASVITGEPPTGNDPFVVWGQDWLTCRVVPGALAARRPFWHVDNGYFRPAGGTARGYYRMTYRGFSPILLPSRLRAPELRPRFLDWKRNGRDVMIAMPGRSFGQAIGLNVGGWIETIEQRVRAKTDRPIVVRPKPKTIPMDGVQAGDFRNVWALVTHSSNVAIDAVVAGIPVFVAPTSPAAPVGRTDLDIEHPVRPERDAWWASLMSQQFTLEEMRRGIARRYMRAIAAQVDNQQGA